jgi:hypothetical protein
VTDERGRVVRVATVIKQREGIDGVSFEFTLATIDVGSNRYGKPRTSCVAVAPATAESDTDTATAQPGRTTGALTINAEQQTILRALRNALDEYGEPAPAALKLPRSITRVVNATVWKTEYLKIAPDAAEAKDNTINARLRRASEKLQSLRVIGRLNPWVWITGWPVKGVIEPRADYQEPYPGRPEPAVPADIGDLIA